MLEDLKIYKKMIEYRGYFRKYGLKWPLFPLLRFEKLISFNIKNLELYIEQDSFNKLKGEIYGMGSSSRSSVVRVVSAVVKRSPK